jgi:hypothetical protein
MNMVLRADAGAKRIRFVFSRVRRIVFCAAAAAFMLGGGAMLSAQSKDGGEAAPGYSVRAEWFNPAYRTVFYSVLEGCFEDGLTDKDVEQILWRPDPERSFYGHFIYACPICTATIHALETYRARPAPYGAKIPGERTFGHGLNAGEHAGLYSDDVKQRLAVIHDLEQRWVARRVASLRLNAEEAAKLQSDLEAARKQGIEVMQSFERDGTAKMYTPAYQQGDECAVCNAATGMKLKLAPAPDGDKDR